MRRCHCIAKKRSTSQRRKYRLRRRLSCVGGLLRFGRCGATAERRCDTSSESGDVPFCSSGSTAPNCTPPFLAQSFSPPYDVVRPLPADPLGQLSQQLFGSLDLCSDAKLLRRFAIAEGHRTDDREANATSSIEWQAFPDLPQFSGNGGNQSKDCTCRISLEA
jgi:hypothetical protein